MEMPSENRQVIREIHDHEILLSFNGDHDAELFSEWWNSKGWPAFEKWASKQGECE